ncbi:rab-GTPase-TBC domain protein (macronuclear) [Tetrahymena thermophila SB210]|uniref:Rab-GTPase-TBC domain protein n=1 Tax=Tetrahymena thermophila (strain SB210) TaxID=312017 RepID=I7M2I7_TETTS|nr:rab-GTPase-TBC domain protein [Tetrahymena thermophila SB210]EAS00532.1 rab-GTPase-TBC domain protein [Tetrahymena thermophila SB210]|eukprot:XP_001020777.1 rab-GTPase-TBC domain protein [Tetrahymena thermophila SB210]
MKNTAHQNEKYPLSNIRKVEYKFVGKRYGQIQTKQMKEESQFEQQNIDIDQELKHQMDHSLMKFDEESHMNLSDSEKQTSITQATDYEDFQNKQISDSKSRNDEKLAQNDKNQNTGLKGFELGISRIKQYQQNQLKEREEHFQKQFQINESSLKKDLQISQRKKANIFSDQNQLQKQQQIFNETMQNNNSNLSSLTQIHMIDQFSNKKIDQKIIKSQGSIQDSLQSNQQQFDNQIKPQSKSYIEQFKPMQSHKSSINDPSPQILQNKYKYQHQQTKDSIPFSNASTNQSVQNKSNSKSLSFYNSLNSTPVSKKEITQFEEYSLNKYNIGQNQVTSDRQIIIESNNSEDAQNQKSQQNIFDQSSNQIYSEDKTQLKQNQKEKIKSDINSKQETNTHTNEQNMDLEQLILTSDMSDESHKQTDEIKVDFKSENDEIIINDLHNQEYIEIGIQKDEIHKKQNLEENEIAVVIIPSQTVETEESEANLNLHEIKRKFDEINYKQNSKKDHLLNESSQFQNNEGKQANVIISDYTLSPEKQQELENQSNKQINNQSQSQFANLRKRIQRSTKNKMQQNQNNPDQQNTRQIFEGNIQLIYTSHDSLADLQIKSNTQQQQDSDFNLEIDEETKKNKINITDFQNSNYKKIALDLKKNLSGSKQQQFEQIEQKVIQDQAVLDNSFSDDSPLSFPQIKQQNLENKSVPTLLFQNINSKKQSSKKISLQQFQTQIMSDSNESDSEREQNSQEEKQENDEMKPAVIDQQNQNSEDQHNDTGDLGLIYFSAVSQDPKQQEISQQNNNNLPKLDFNTIKYQKDSNLIIFSNHQIELNDKIQSNEQVQDDFNNFEVSHNLVLSNYQNKEEILTEAVGQNQQKINSSNKDDKQTNIDDKKIASFSGAQKGKVEKTHILQFETEEESDNNNSSTKGNNELQQTITPDESILKGSDGEIITQFCVEIPSKKIRMQRIKAFSQNNTPINNKYNQSSQINEQRNSAEQFIDKFKGRPSTFLTRLQQYKEHAFNKEYNQIIEDKQQIQKESPETDKFPEFIISSWGQQQAQQPEKQTTSSSEDKLSNEKQNSENQHDVLFTQSADEIEDFYEEEDEEDDELDEEEDEAEQDNNIIAFQEMQDRAQCFQKQEFQNKRQLEQGKQKEQNKINQREIGIGKYFYEKMCNVYGDTKLFQKKKRNLKKWLKMIQQAENSLNRKSQENYDYLQLNEKLKLSSNCLVSIQIEPSNDQDFQNNQKTTQVKNENIIDAQNDEKMQKNQADLLKRKIFQQKLLDQNNSNIFSPFVSKNKQFQDQQTNTHKKSNSQENEQLTKQLTNHDQLTAEEEFQLIYQFKKIQKNEFLKALKKGPPMWYRWSAWKVALDLNVEEYRETYEKLKPTEPLNFDHTYTDPIDKQINKDITRTIPDEPFFSDPQYSQKSLQSLRNVLKAVSLYYDNVGYCQGMNFLAAFLLLINGGDELQAFSMFIQMEKKLNIMGLFEEEFPLIQFMNFVFQREFGRKFPKLFRHFNKLKIPETMWVVQWFQTIFLNSLSLNVVCRFWDYIFYQGSIISAISISLSLIHEYNAHLIKKNELDEISQFIQKLKQCSVQKGELRNSPCKPRPLLSPLINFLQKDTLNLEENIVIDPEKIIKRAQQYELSKKEIISYINEFKQLNFLYKDKPFLKKMEEAINTENLDENQVKNQYNHHNSTPHNASKQKQSKLNTQQTSKSHANQVKSPELQSLLRHGHAQSQIENKKNLFSILGFNTQKKTQNNM